MGKTAGSWASGNAANTATGDDRQPSLCPGQLLAGAVSSVQGEPGHACTSPWTPSAAPPSAALCVCVCGGGYGGGLALWTACKAGPRGPLSAQALGPRVRLLWTQPCQVRHCQGVWAGVLETPAQSTQWSGDPGPFLHLLGASTTSCVQQIEEHTTPREQMSRFSKQQRQVPGMRGTVGRQGRGWGWWPVSNWRALAHLEAPGLSPPLRGLDLREARNPDFHMHSADV